jgi:hypothetical protein
MAKYDPQLCEDYVRRALDLGTVTFTRLWVHAAGLVPVHPPEVPTLQLDAMAVEFTNMGPWDQQGVLFLMAGHIDKIARYAAMNAASRARVADPI